MWLSEDDISEAWGSIKNFAGQAWSHGHKVFSTVDRFANLAGRLLGAGAQTGLLRGRALEGATQAAGEYGKLRSSAMGYGRDIQKTVEHFRQAAPELNL